MLILQIALGVILGLMSLGVVYVALLTVLDWWENTNSRQKLGLLGLVLLTVAVISGALAYLLLNL
jgi:hypothetical protein